MVAIRQIAENADLCEGHCQECTKICTGLRIATKIVSGIKDTETRTKCLALKAEEFNVDKVVDVCRTEESLTKMNKTWQESMFIRYPTISKIREGAQLKDDNPKENHHGNMAEMTVSHQRKEVKANQTIQTVLVVDTIILESRARQKQSTATTVRRWDTLRNNVG